MVSGRKRLERFLLVAASIGVTLPLLELGLRLAPHAHGDSGSIEWFACHYDPQLGWKGNPNLVLYDGKGTAPENAVYATNAAGYNDREWPARRPDGDGKRIVVLGDSFAYGFGVHVGEAFPRQLERRLGGGTQVISLGLPGYSTDQEDLALEGEALALEPDLVILQMFMDDIFNNGAIATHDGKYPKPLFEYRDGHLGLDNVPVPALRSPSALLATLKERLYRLRTRLHTASRWRKADWTSVFDREFIDSDQWRVTFALLERMRDACARRNVRFAVVLVPLADQVLDPGLRTPQTVLSEFGRRAGIPVLDLLPQFENRVEATYLENDLHWTAEGHRVAAAEIASFLLRARLLL